MNRRRAHAFFAGALLLSLASTVLADSPTGESAADEQRLPLAKTERPLTLPRFILQLELGGDVTRLGSNGSYGNLGFAPSFGVTDALSVRMQVLPVQLAGPPGSGGFHYGQSVQDRGPSVGATFAFVHGVVELGVGLDLRVFTAQDVSGGAIIPAVPLHVHLGKRVRLDAAAELSVTRATTTAPGGVLPPGPGTTTGTFPANAVRLQVPVSALFNLAEPFYVGVTTGLTINDFNNVKNTTGIPVGVVAGYAIAGRHGPLLDIDPYFNFPYLIMPGASSVTNAGEYVVGLRLDGYLYY